MTALLPISGGPIDASGASIAATTPPEPIPIVTDLGTIFASAPSVTLSQSSDLTAGWTEIQHAFCSRLRRTLAPAIDQATILWEYGNKMPAGTTAFERFSPLALEGKFIRIHIAAVDPIRWYGIAEVSNVSPHGNGAVSDPASSGHQMITVYGLLRLLERKQISTAIVADKDEASHITIGRGLTFNLDDRGEFSERGNRSSVTSIDGSTSHVFSYHERGQTEWTAEEAVRHLLEHHAPQLTGFTWELVITSGNLDWNPRAVDTDRRTVKAVLDDLIPRQRGVGYRLEFDGVSKLRLIVSSQADVDIAMPNGTTFLANPDQYSLDFERALDITNCDLVDTKTTQYHTIVVEGEWRTSTLSLRLDESVLELVKDWTDADERDYLNGASAETWYAGLPVQKRTEANKVARRSDRLQHVFARFRVGDNWSLTNNSGNAAFPQIDVHNPNPIPATFNVSTSIARLRLLDRLPLRERYDYSGNHIAAKDWTTTVADITDEPPFRDPFSFVQTNLVAGSTWELLDKIDGGALEQPDPRRWKVTTAAHHDRPAVTLTVNGGEPHFLAKDKWAATGTIDSGTWNATTNTPSLASGVGITGQRYRVAVAGQTTLDGFSNWLLGDILYFDGTRWQRPPAVSEPQDDPSRHGLNYSAAWCTLTLEHPERARIERIISLPVDTEQTRELRIRVHDARLDYVVPNTIVGIKNGNRQISDGGFVRDDTDKLATLARAAEVWYGKQRQNLDLTFRQVREIVQLGWLITDVGGTYNKTDVNSIVTAITFDFLQVTTQFETQYLEFDLLD